MKKMPKMIAFSLSLMLGLGATIYMQSPTRANAESWSEINFQDEYDLNETFVMPKLTLKVGDIEALAEPVLIYPSNKNSVKSTNVLNEVGTYQVRYTGFIGEKSYIKTFKFVVNSSFMSFGEGTSVSYTTPNESKSEGLYVKLAQGDTLRFNEIIDLKDLKSTDDLVKTYIVPKNRGSNDFEKLTFTLTDAADPNNYLRLNIDRDEKLVTGYGFSFLYVAGNGQPNVGMETWNKRIHINDNEGTYAGCSFDGYISTQRQEDGKTIYYPHYDLDYDSRTLSFRYNKETLQIQAGETLLNGYGIVQKKDYLQLVTDLDDPAFYSTKLWHGFTSNKVYLSITADGYISNSADFVLTKVFGLDLTKDSLYDEVPPVITLDGDYSNMPEGIVGGSYPIPTATAYDDYSGKCDVDVNVWYEYGTPNAVMAEVQNNKIITNKAGTYSIVYKAQDKFLNEATKVLNLHVGGTIPEIVINIKEHETTATVGKSVFVGDFEASGGSGSLQGKIYVKDTDGIETEITSVRNFRPEKAGIYKVIYEISDFVGSSKRFSYNVEAITSNIPLLPEELTLPKAFIVKGSYKLPLATAYDYSSGNKVPVECKVKVTSNGVIKEYNPGDSLLVEECTSTKIQYVANTTVVYEEELPVVTGVIDNRIVMKNYFIGDNSEIITSEADDGFVLSALENGNAKTLFANSMLTNEFALDFDILDGKDNFSSIDIILTDAENKNVSIKAEIKKIDSEYFIIVGNKQEKLLSSNIALFYSEGLFRVGGSYLPISTNIGEKAYLEIVMNDATGSAAIKLNTIGNHILSTGGRDGVKPQVRIIGSYGGDYELGSSYFTNVVLAQDIAAPNTTCLVTIIGPNGEPAKVKGTNIEVRELPSDVSYEIELNEFGLFTFVYSAYETPGFSPRKNVDDTSFTIRTEDSIPPVIEVTTKMVKSCKVNDVLALPTFVVTDNVTPSEEIVILKTVINPGGLTYIIPNDAKTFKFTEEGRYEFHVVAYDQVGNIATYRSYVNVK